MSDALRVARSVALGARSAAYAAAVTTIESTRGFGSSDATAKVTSAVPAAFAEAVADIRATNLRSEIRVSDVPPPRRVAPHALALDAAIDVAAVSRRSSSRSRRRTRPGEPDLAPGGDGDFDGTYDETSDLADAGGRFVLLHDPSHPPDWDGDMRVIALVKAVVDPELAGDPLMADIAWAWLVESLDAAEAGYVELGGTITQVTSASFGSLAGRRSSVQVELRASWTPTSPAGRHVEAWAQTLCALAGVPPVGPAVIPRSPRR